MEASVEFVCPECSATCSIKLVDFSPARNRHCPTCRCELQLCPASLDTLRRSLPRLFPT